LCSQRQIKKKYQERGVAAVAPLSRRATCYVSEMFGRGAGSGEARVKKRLNRRLAKREGTRDVMRHGMKHWQSLNARVVF